ncbi:Cornichon protein [Dioscorea alata]|uniref:Cornichon protein n=1 Tax=Dioscorea alata TaxID=55571 RepID=A0ACB7WG43_DIOAL|nr:Cornichon protein [Dioscorea alata]
MVGGLLVWLIAFFLLVALLVVVAYQLMCLADLEFDYINPYDSASRINYVVLPEFVLQGILSLLFLLSGHWFMFLFSTPVLYYNVKLYQSRHHLIDVTEIFNLLNREKKRRLFKLIYFVSLLFLSLFWMIWSVMEDDD